MIFSFPGPVQVEKSWKASRHSPASYFQAARKLPKVIFASCQKSQKMKSLPFYFAKVARKLKTVEK